MKNKKVIITGGAGLIGSYLTEIACQIYENVIVVDDFSKGDISNLRKVEDKIEIRKVDLEDFPVAKDALSDGDIVFHLASRAYGVAYSDGRHMEILNHNENITNNLFKALAGTKTGKVLVTSSSCVYSDDGPDTMAECPIFVGEPEMANWGYGWAKRFLEQKSIIFSNETSIPVTIVRPFNIYGERYQWVGQYSQAIPMLIKRILDGENPVVI